MLCAWAHENHPYGNQQPPLHPSHLNSPFYLVHDHLEQHAHASVNHTGGWAPLVHAWLHHVHARGVYFAIVPNFSLASPYYHRKERAIVNLALSKRSLFHERSYTRRESSIENIPQVCLVIALRELERQGRTESNLFKVREARSWRARLWRRERASELMNFLSAPVASKLLVASPITGCFVRTRYYQSHDCGN